MKKTLFLTFLTLLTFSLILSACESSDDEETNTDGTMMTTSSEQVKDYSDAKIEEVCKEYISIQKDFIQNIPCFFIGAFGEPDACEMNVQSCLDEQPEFDLETYDLNQPCTEENFGAPECLYVECKDMLMEQKEAGCTATEGLIYSCVQDSVVPVTSELVCSEEEEEEADPASCQELEMLCPTIDEDDEGGEGEEGEEGEEGGEGGEGDEGDEGGEGGEGGEGDEGGEGGE